MTPMALTCDDAWQVLAGIMDPELPAVSVVDLGMVRAVEIVDGGVRVTLTPTYSGCPAFVVIEQAIACALEAHGFVGVNIEKSLSPAWSSDDVSEVGRRKLEFAGIAPPERQTGKSTKRLAADMRVRCPHCGSFHTVTRSEFGSTACKSLMTCSDCGEPFERFKPL